MGNKIFIQKTLRNIPDEINKSQIIESENKKFKDISQYNTINSSTFFNPIGFKKNNEYLTNFELNIHADEFCPKNRNLNKDEEKMELNINAKEYIPKHKKLNNILKQNKEQEKKEEKKENKYTYEYIMKFANLKISNEKNLLPESTLNHLDNFKIVEKINIKLDTNKKSPYKNEGSNTINTMEQWARKDLSKENEEADKNKKIFEETNKKEPIKRELRGLLNMLTKDNYENIKNKILEIIIKNEKNQEILVDIFFQKAVSEKYYIKLYAELLKELDKEIRKKNKSVKKEKGSKSTYSVLRKDLVDKCSVIFKKSEKMYEYIKEKDPYDRENKFKNYILGNANFITELINTKILSKKVAIECIYHLFKKYENENNTKLKLISIQEIIIFIDKFGTLINSIKNDLDSKDFKFYDEEIKKIFEKLEDIKNDKEIPGYIKYTIINLIEKKKNNYEKTEFEKSMIAKSKEEVEEEFKNKEKRFEEENDDEQETEEGDIENNDGSITQEEINEKMKSGLNEYKDMLDEEGNSNNYSWNETTFLYEIKKQQFDSIIEGYIISCADFIEKKDNIKYAKDYIRELIEYYHEKFNQKEIMNLKKV
jgi:hypothetical protein